MSESAGVGSGVSSGVSNGPRVVFCTTCKGRAQHLAQTLPKNLEHGRGTGCKFVVLGYGVDEELSRYMLFHKHDLNSGYLTFYSSPEQSTFRMAHAKNMAHRVGMLEGADVLVNLDADNYIGEGFAQYVGQKFAENENTFLWANRNQPSPLRYPKGCNGRIAVSRKMFLKTGGYDEAKYNAWGPDDKDFHHRLRRFDAVACEIPRKFLDVILHSDKMRFKEYKHVKSDVQSEEFQAVDETATIANWGVFGCGTVYRNFEYTKAITLAPLPTRIFGIGLHKTGTTSLNTALRILGYESAHWRSAHWAKAIWREMNNTGKSPTMEKSYALSDLPFPLMYDRLDKAYPGSKFILTVREEESWVQSVERHWDPRYNQFREAWDSDPFTNIIHERLYGRTDFDREIFLARYRKHNADALEYFRDRPQDLLVMKTEDSGWGPLCAFLGRPVPEVEYPRMYVSQ